MKTPLIALKFVLKYLTYKDRHKYHVPSDNEYVHFEINHFYEEDQKLAHAFDIYNPKELKSDISIIDVHGGGYVYGFKELNRDYLMHFVRAGFKVFNINYSLCSNNGTDQEKQILDVVSFLLYLDKHYEEFNINPQNICLMADSAGAHLALMAYYISNFEDVARLFNVQTLKNIKITSLVLSSPCYNYEDVVNWFSRQASKKLLHYMGGLHIGDTLYFQKLNPARYISKYKLPKTFVSSAEKDFLLFTSKNLINDVRTNNIPHRFYYLNAYKKEIGHVFNIVSYEEDFAIKCNDAIIEFLLNDKVDQKVKFHS